MEPSLVLNASGNEDFLELVRCKICLLISLHPVTCKKCESVFCKQCIENWKKQKNTCPLRCTPLEIKEENRIIKNILSKFFYKCQICLNKINLADFDEHQKICHQDLQTCDCCGEVMMSYLMNTHIKLFCPEVLETCNACGSHVKRKLMKQHEEPKDISEYNKIKLLENELKLKDEIIHQLQSKVFQQEGNF
jgi:hypothetical protein